MYIYNMYIYSSVWQSSLNETEATRQHHQGTRSCMQCQGPNASMRRHRHCLVTGKSIFKTNGDCIHKFTRALGLPETHRN